MDCRSPEVSQDFPSSRKGTPTTLNPVKIHPQNQFIDVTLIFQLTLDDISMGYIMKKKGSDGIPYLIAKEATLAARTEKHQYLFGNDVNVCTKQVARLWSLRTILRKDDHENQQHKTKKCSNRTSYLVGMLLKKLRGKAESRFRQKFSKGIVAFPRHMQLRCHNFSRNVLAGAKSHAGFENMHILEENECLARAFLSSVDKSQCRSRVLLVLSQNSQFVDVIRHYFDEDLNVTKGEGKIIDKAEKSGLEKWIGNIATSEKYSKDVNSTHTHDDNMAAAVVGSGYFNPDIYVRKLLNHFKTVNYFEDTTLAVIIGAVLAVTNGENKEHA